jgi:hypothetical protein
MIADPIVCDSTPLTPYQACKLLLGPRYYRLYTEWKFNIASKDEAKHYDSTQQWTEVRDLVASEPIGHPPSSQAYKCFMIRHKVELYPQDEDSEPQVEEEQERGDEQITPRFLKARLCGHAVHPGNPFPIEDACPVCYMRVCIASLKRIAHVWNLLGGPKMGKPVDPIECGIYAIVRKLWRMEKVHWARFVHTGGMIADMERNWEAEAQQVGSSIDDDVRRCKSFIEALEIARECPFLGEGWDVTFVPKPTVRTGKTPVVDRGGQGASSTLTHQLPHLPTYSPETAEADPSLPLQCDGAFETPQDDRTPRPSREDEAVAFSLSDTVTHPPSPSASPPDLPSSPPSSPSSSSSSSTEAHKVTFAADVFEQPIRKAKEYRRTASAYQKGRYAAPPGSEWQDTSFSRDSLYDSWGVAENDEKALNWLIKAREEAVQEEAGVNIGELEYVHRAIDWSEDKENENDEVLDRLERTRDESFGVDFDLFEEREGEEFERPLFRFGPRKPSPVGDAVSEGEREMEERERSVLPVPIHISTAPETESPTTAAEDDEDGRKLGEIPLAGHGSPRRRCHDEFEEDGDAKRVCRWASFMNANGHGFC